MPNFIPKLSLRGSCRTLGFSCARVQPFRTRFSFRQGRQVAGVLGLCPPASDQPARGNGGELVLLGVADASGNVILRRSFAAPRLVAVTASMALFRRDGGGLEKRGLHGPAFRGLGALFLVLCSRAVVDSVLYIDRNPPVTAC
jgi:hypothetical protein